MKLKNQSQFLNRRRRLRQNQTDAEKKFWSLVRNRKISDYRFLRQYSIGRYILDFYCPALNLGIELDGGQHLEPKQLQYDRMRAKYLAEVGIDVLRFWDNEVLTNAEGVYMILQQQIDRITSVSPLFPLFCKEGLGELVAPTHPTCGFATKWQASPLFDKERE